MENPEFIWPNEAAKMLGVTTCSIHRYCKKYGLKHRKTPGGRLQVHRESLEFFLRSTTTGGIPTVKKVTRPDKRAKKGARHVKT